MPFRAEALVGVQSNCSVFGTSGLASPVPCPSGEELPLSVIST